MGAKPRGNPGLTADMILQQAVAMMSSLYEAGSMQRVAFTTAGFRKIKTYVTYHDMTRTICALFLANTGGRIRPSATNGFVKWLIERLIVTLKTMRLHVALPRLAAFALMTET